MQAELVSTAGPVNPKAKIWWIRLAAIVVTGVLLLMSAPVIWTALSAGVGLLALTTVAVIGVVAMTALPLGMQRLENRILILRKAEAQRNPIEQLQNEMLRRSERLVTFRTALVTVGGQIESIKQKIEDGQSRSSGQVLSRQKRAMERLEQFYSINIGRLNHAHVALQEFKNTVEQKQREWEIALAIDQANRSMDPNAGENLIQDLLADTALRAVQDRFNHVFAELDVQLNSMDAPTRDLLDQSSTSRLDALTLPTSNNRR